MRTPIETDVAVKIRNIVESILETGKDDALHNCPLIPKTPDEMQLLLDFAQYHKPIFMPKQVTIKDLSDFLNKGFLLILRYQFLRGFACLTF